jgi:hypothetical protein
MGRGTYYTGIKKPRTPYQSGNNIVDGNFRPENDLEGAIEGI